MAKILRYAGQAVAYALIAVLVGYFSNSPAYTHFPPDKALIRLTLTHGGKPKGECRRLSREELEKLPVNMRKPVSCPRERLPVVIDLSMDGRALYHRALPPTGLSGDGPAQLYQNLTVEPGHHVLVARLRDTARTDGYDYESRAELDLAPGRSLMIDFRGDAGKFIFE